MVIFHHGDATKDKGEEVREGTVHKGISHGRRSFTTKNVTWRGCFNGGKEREKGGA